MGQSVQNGLIRPLLLALACLYLSSAARADVVGRAGAAADRVDYHHLTNPKPSSGSTDPNDTGTVSNHPGATPGSAVADERSAALIAGAKVTGAPRDIPWLWIIVTGVLSFGALGMGGHIILRGERA
jgi:hypothetical protein